MRRFFIENRRRISQIIVVILALILTKFFIDQTASIEEKILSSNHKIYYNNKSVYLKNININEIKNAVDYTKTYVSLDLNSDNIKEILLKYHGNNNDYYFYIYKQNKKYILQGPITLTGLSNIKQDGTIKIDDNTIGILKFNDYNITFERITYINNANEKIEYIVDSKISDKSTFDMSIREFEAKQSMNWKKF